MTSKSDFSADEWSTIVEGPLLAGMRVVTARRGGTIRESLAIGQTYARARRQHGESDLLDDLVSSPPAMDPSRLPSDADIGRVTTEHLGKAVQLLERRASPEEVDAYKRFVLTLAEAAADAHREGGFLGVGGEKVSEGERVALDEIAASLRRASQ
jgi:hypothetical protein